MRIDITLLDDTGVPHDLAIQARPDHTAASLARALTALGHAQVQASEVTGLRNGALVGEPPRPIGATGLQVVGGPDSGLAYALRPGRTLIGRGADCELRLGDPAVSRRHVAVEVGRAGIQVTNLSDTAPARLSGVPLTGRQRLDAGDEVELGNTVIRLAGPQAQPDVAAARIAMPIPPHRSAGAPTGLGAAATSALTAVALALALGSAQLLWLGLIGPAGMIVSGLGGRRSRRRADRVQQHRHRDELKRVAAEIQAGVAAEAQARRRADPDPATLLAAADGQYGDRLDRGLTLRVGSGRAEAALAVQRPGEADEHPLLERVPLRVDLGAGPLRLLAPRPVALGQARWLVAQLVARTPPELLRISLDVDDEAAWHWLRWLPHLYPPHADRGGLEAWATAAPARRVLRVHDRARAAGLTLDVTDGAGTIQTSRPADDTGIRHRLDVQALDVRGEVLVDMLAAGDAERWARRLAARPSADGGLPEI
ncbi:FHA domain-containing protein [Jatrophihabitans sp.]|uniref:FHA domain-containing protein n=1 Tax=Jatrophihabitans sp. TaxID=1932789 RepID=UPI0030C7042D|nr:domain containing protein [Jatrophihabitans sp.]